MWRRCGCGAEFIEALGKTVCPACEVDERKRLAERTRTRCATCEQPLLKEEPGPDCRKCVEHKRHVSEALS